MHDSIGRRIDNSNTCSALVRCFFVFEQPSTSPTNATVLEPCSQRTNKATAKAVFFFHRTVRAGTLTLTTTSCVAKLGDKTWAEQPGPAPSLDIAGAERRRRRAPSVAAVHLLLLQRWRSGPLYVRVSRRNGAIPLSFRPSRFLRPSTPYGPQRKQ